MPVNARPASGLPQGPMLCEVMVPASVDTAPPPEVWNGSGMSMLCLLGQSAKAPAMTAMAIAISNPTTTLAATGPNGTGESLWP